MLLITNISSRCVVVDINGSRAGIIPPGQSLSSGFSFPAVTTISLQHQTESYSYQSSAHLLLISTYTLSMTENVQLTVSREKIRFEMNGYYDRFSLTAQGAQVLNIQYTATNVDGVRKGLKRHHILTAFVYDPLSELFLEPFIEFGIVGALLLYAGTIFVATFFNLWGFVFAFILALWVLIGIISMFADKGLNWLFKKIGKYEKSALEQLSQWVDPAYITNYYTQPTENPFWEILRETENSRKATLSGC